MNEIKSKEVNKKFEEVINKLTADDLHFLSSLGSELKTQDTRATRKPVIFRIAKKERVLYLDPKIYDTCVLIGDSKENADFLPYHNDGDLEAVKGYLHHYRDFSLEELKEVNDLESLENLCECNGLYYAYTGYKVETKYENYFLTETGVNDYINENKYKLDGNIDYYIAHAQSYELERLLTIVEKFADIKE